MIKHNDTFKEKIKQYGRQLDSIITFGETTLTKEQLNVVTPVLQSALLKSVMKELDIDSNVEIPIGTILNYKLGVRVSNNEDYEYLDYGDYVVYKSERQENEKSYKIIAYDKMLNSMKNYTTLRSNKIFPMSVRDYLKSICQDLELEFADYDKEFANYDKIITSDLYANLGYTYRDILDELAQVTASNIIINENDQVAIKYVTDTEDEINEEFLKNVNVNFGQKYGPINSIVLSRSAGADNVYLRDEASITENGLCELKISDNQIMNFNDRSDYLPAILNAVGGLEYYINDFDSTGVCYYEVADKYNVKIGENTYPCIMFNDEINVTTGLFETIHTDMPEQAETDYTKADKTDRRLNQTYLIVDKQNQTIESVVSQVDGQNEKISKVEQTVDELRQEITQTVGLTITEETTNANLTINGLANGEPVRIIVRPYGIDLGRTYPRLGFYPSSGTFSQPDTVTLVVENVDTKEQFTYKLRNDLFYMDEDAYDIFEYTYGNDKCTITQNVGFRDGQAYKLDTPVVNEYDFPTIELKEGNYNVYLIGYSSGYILFEAMAKNDYTDIFATKKELRSSITQTEDKIESEVSNVTSLLDKEVETLDSRITQTADDITAEVNKKIGEDEAKALIKATADEINLEVSKKVGEDEIISKINQSAEQIQIEADKISLEGKEINLTSDNITIESNNFSVDKQGNLNCNGAEMTDVKIRNGDIVLEEPSIASQSIVIRGYLSGERTELSMSSNMIEMTDNFNDSYCSIYGGNFETDSGSFTSGSGSTYISHRNTAIEGYYNYDRQFNLAVSSSAGGFLNLYDTSQTATILLQGVGGTIYCTRLNQGSLKEQKKNFEKFDNALQIIDGIDLYKYNYKDEEDGTKKHIGFVIGDDFNYSSEITATDENGKENGVDIYSMISLCMKAIKEQQVLIKDLQNEIEKLKNENSPKEEIKDGQ